jgi:hypothetical protein
MREAKRKNRKKTEGKIKERSTNVLLWLILEEFVVERAVSLFNGFNLISLILLKFCVEQR